MPSLLARFPWLRVVLSVWCLVLWSLPAMAQDSKKSECAAAYEKSQELRGSGKLLAAKEMLVVCAQESCPAFVQSDCAQWLMEVQKEMPTILVEAKDLEGGDTVSVKVTMDGEILTEELDGKPIFVDPGAHKFKFELEGAPPIEQKIVIRQAQKDRLIEVKFTPHGADLPADSPYGGGPEPKASTEPAPEPDHTSADEGKPGPLRPYAYIAGGVGGAGILGWVIFGIVGKGQESDLKDTCSPNCAQSEVDSVKTKYLLADISLGVGVAGLGTGVALFFLSQPKGDASASDDSADLRLDLRTAPGGAFGSVSGRF